MTFSNYDADAEPLLERLGWKKLADRRKSHMATMVYKSLNDLAPEYLKAKFVNRSCITDYILRDTRNKLAVPKPPPKDELSKKSFQYSGAVLWNSPRTAFEQFPCSGVKAFSRTDLFLVHSSREIRPITCVHT